MPSHRWEALWVSTVTSGSLASGHVSRTLHLPLFLAVHKSLRAHWHLRQPRSISETDLSHAEESTLCLWPLDPRFCHPGLLPECPPATCQGDSHRAGPGAHLPGV